MSEVILFDFDGTITDSGEGITKCVQYALSHFGINEPDLKKLECFIGPPLKEQLIKYGNLSVKQAETAQALFRERYNKEGIHENKVYDGIESVLGLLKARGKTLGIASSKPTVHINQILEQCKLTQYFDVVVGAELDDSKADKAEVIERALELLGMQDNRAAVVMVGDRFYDVVGALKCGIQCIGVAYGYGGIYELETAGAIYIAQTVEDLKVLAGNSRAEASRRNQNAKDSGQRKVTQIGFLGKIWQIFYPLGIYFFLVVLATIVASLVLMTLSGKMYGYDIESILTVEKEYALFIMGAVAILALPVFIKIYQKDQTLRARGRLVRVRGRQKGISVGSYLAAILLMVSASQIFAMMVEEGKPLTNQTITVTIIVVGVLIPLIEEIVFRGVIFKRLQEYTGTVVAIFLSGLLYGIYHESITQCIYAVIIGWLLAFVFSQADNILVPIAGHMAANLLRIFGRDFTKSIVADNVVKYIVLSVLIVMAVLSLIYIGNSRRKLQGE